MGVGETIAIIVCLIIMLCAIYFYLCFIGWIIFAFLKIIEAIFGNGEDE